MSKEFREPFAGRYWTIINVEGDGEPPVLYRSQETADLELARRRELPEDDDAWLSEYHHVLPCDVAGALWNSYDDDPRADNPLMPEEIAKLHAGDAAPPLVLARETSSVKAPHGAEADCG